ncbi:sensor histidine kinase [Vitreimonas sp.]|uniref:sensor histidine kinase n=1 Tax=Vitreimonas sp. TaxID=3069702 RepID=UPI002EDAA65B
MGATSEHRRIWVMTIRRFVELAWAGHGLTRYASVTVVPLLVGMIVPGPWWIPCAIGGIAGLIADHFAQRAFTRLSARLDALDDKALRGVFAGHTLVLAVVTFSYVAPYALLALAPQPGPLIGLMFSAGALMICTSLHIMTPRMIFFTSPPIIVSLIANGYVLGGESALLGAALAGILGGNAIVMARANAGSFRDLMKAQLKAEQAAEELERRVDERTAQLAIATRRAQTANRAKSMFLANMSHELRTPLNAVIGYAEIVQEDIKSGDTEQCAADLGRIRNAASHLLAMITEVLDFSRIEAGKVELAPTTFDLAALLRAAADDVRLVAEKNNTQLKVTVAPAVASIFADQTRVRQCVLNLMSNAAKFTQDGAIEVEAGPCRIDGAPGVAIVVRDTGQGIAPEDLKRLFQPFVQVDNTNTRVHDGAGLGLVITRRLARAMGGNVVAESAPGKGSTFTLYLRSTPRVVEQAA